MNAPTYTESQIAAAVAWWRAALERPKYDALGTQRDHSMELAQMMMSAYGARLTDEQLDAFAAHLSDVLAGRCEHTWKYYAEEHPVRVDDGCLSVDYQPDVYLAHCGEIAGFPPGFFWPIKTSMYLRDGSVRVRHGYGAEIVTIHPASFVTDGAT